MNGRCDNDPFKRAVDVCDACHLDICDDCVVKLPGRRHPVCRDCALEMSGAVRSNRTKRRGDRRTARERREHHHRLNAESNDNEPFTYFDEADGFGDHPIEDPSKRRSWLRRVVASLESKPEALGSHHHQETTHQSAVERLAELKERGIDAGDHGGHDRPDRHTGSTPVAPWQRPLRESPANAAGTPASRADEDDRSGGGEDRTGGHAMSPHLRRLLQSDQR